LIAATSIASVFTFTMASTGSGWAQLKKVERSHFAQHATPSANKPTVL